jgi:hypothetical protein
MFLIMLVTISLLISSLFFNLANIINKNKYISPSPSGGSPSGYSPSPSGGPPSPSPSGGPPSGYSPSPSGGPPSGYSPSPSGGPPSGYSPSPSGGPPSGYSPSPSPSGGPPSGDSPSPSGGPPPSVYSPPPSATIKKASCDKYKGCTEDDHGTFSSEEHCRSSNSCGTICDPKEGCIYSTNSPPGGYLQENACDSDCKFYGCSDGTKFGQNYYGECREIDHNSYSQGEYSTKPKFCDNYKVNCLKDKHSCCHNASYDGNNAKLGTICNSSYPGSETRTQKVVYQDTGGKKLWNLNTPCNNEDSIPCGSSQYYTWLQQKDLKSYACGYNTLPLSYYGRANKVSTTQDQAKPCDESNCNGQTPYYKKYYRNGTASTIGSWAGDYITCNNQNTYYPVVDGYYNGNNIYACIPKYLNETINSVTSTSHVLSKNQCGFKKGTIGKSMNFIQLSENCKSLSFDYDNVTSDKCSYETKNIKCFNNNDATGEKNGNTCVFKCPVNWDNI